MWGVTDQNYINIIKSLTHLNLAGNAFNKPNYVRLYPDAWQRYVQL